MRALDQLRALRDLIAPAGVWLPGRSDGAADAAGHACRVRAPEARRFGLLGGLVHLGRDGDERLRAVDVLCRAVGADLRACGEGRGARLQHRRTAEAPAAAGGTLMPGRDAPARFPPHGAWPAVMRADMVAAFFDFDTVGALMTALAKGEVPRPTDSRMRGRTREPLWSADACRSFVANRHDLADGPESDNLAALV